MAQTTNLNVSPYFDDFNADDNYYKVLFKPGFPVQARELTGLQSILQDQIAKFGTHMFKEGAKVIPGNTTYNSNFACVEINNEYLGVTVKSYIDQLLNRKIVGLRTGVSATVVKILDSTDSIRDNLTLYIRYDTSSTSNENSSIASGELLAADIDIVSGPENSTFIPKGEAFAGAISQNAASIASSFSISEGVYFIRGTFVSVASQTILLDQYGNTPTGRIGLRVLEETVNSDEDSSLTDNSKGFNNFAAPGADRLKISCSLFFKPLDDTNDDDFVELASVRSGILRTRPTTSDYNLLNDELARRTFAESGDYTVKPFSIRVRESLNDDLGNGGVFGQGQATESGVVANDDLALFQVSSGKAFVKGYEIETISSSFLDVEKPRTTKKIESQRVNYKTGASLTLNRQTGSPEVGIGNTFVVSLRDQRSDGLPTGGTIVGSEIGVARVYDFVLESGSYNATNSNINEYDISLFDIQTFTNVTLNQAITLSTPAFIKGKFSGATGFLRSNASNTTSLSIYDRSGDLVPNEPLIINGEENSRIALAVTSFGISDVKSLYAGPNLGNVGSAKSFVADVVQQDLFNFGSANMTSATGSGSVSISTITSGNPLFPGKLKVGNLLKFGGLGNDDKSLVRITAVNTSDVVVTGVATVTGVTEGALYKSTAGTSLEVPDLTLVTTPFSRSDDNTLFTEMPRKNVSDVDISSATLNIRKTFDVTINASDDQLTTAVLAGTNETFLPFDEERYSLIRKDGVQERLTDDKFEFSDGNGTLQISNIGSDLSGNLDATLVATLSKTGVTAKVKRKQRINSQLIDKSSSTGSGTGGATLNDGLTAGGYPFGTRVQDEKISLNTPDVLRVLGIFESLSTADPSAPKMILSSIDSPAGKTTDLIIGEKIKGLQSGAVAVVAEILSDSQISFVILNDIGFREGEFVNFEESAVQAVVNTLDNVSKNITGNYSFNTGQKSTIYDFGFIKRLNGRRSPTKKIKVYFESAYFETSDDGDVTVKNSYNDFNYNGDIQSINGIRNTDIIDIRPRVSNYDVTESERSPLEFFGRSFDASGNSAANVLASDESIILDFSFYLGRIDRIFLTKNGNFSIAEGAPSENPDKPIAVDDALEIAEVVLPAYLYDVNDAEISFLKHKRYRMKDIRVLEQRIQNLEYYTTLSLLETDTANLFVSDENGLNKFKSGFFVDNFTTILPQETGVAVKNSIDIKRKELRSSHYCNLIDLQVGPVEGQNNIFNGADPEGTNIRKTGNVLTLDYEETPYLTQSFGTRTESVTPFILNFWEASLELRPASDTWVDTVRLDARIIEREGNFASTVAEAERSFGGFDPQTGLTSTIWEGWDTVWTGSGQEFTTSNRQQRIQQGNQIINQQITDTFLESFRTGTSNRSGSRQLITEQFDQESIGDVLVSSEVIPRIRSRNVSFDGRGFKPQSRLFAFFDGVNMTKYCIPKLIEISMISGVFQVGETVTGEIFSENTADPATIKFRVAVSNHREGPFDNPTRIYAKNPYTTQTALTAIETYSGSPGVVQLSGGVLIPPTYSSTSTTINVDCESLAEQAQGDFFGRIETGMILKGGTSGAEAQVTDLRLISDYAATCLGSFFIPNPNIVTNPTFQTGRRTFTLIDNEQNNRGQASTIASEVFDSTGTLETVQENIISLRNARVQNQSVNESRSEREVTGSVLIASNVTGQTVEQQVDPLAQSFYVGDSTGIFATSVEVYFQTVDQGNIPVQLDLRTVKLGVPSQEVLPFSQLTLDPDQITTSSNGSVSTKFNFKAPVYLSPGTEYAICMLSASADYRVFISRIGENDLITDEFVSNQPTLGSLFKSQNASTWEPSQWEDLKFIINRAEFSTSGSVEIYNPILSEGNSQIPKLLPNSLNLQTKKIRIGISSAFSGKANDVHPTVGNVISQSQDVSGASGNLVATAGIATGTLTVSRAGIGYTPASGNRGLIGIALSTITGSGRDATANVHFDGGVAVAATIVSGGEGYTVGDVLGISTNLGINARLTVASIGSTSELIVDNVQGKFAVGTGKTLFFSGGLNAIGDIIGITSAVTGAGGTYGAFPTTSGITTISDGLHIEVNHKNHGMHHQINRVVISGAESDVAETKLTAPYANDSTANISIGSTSEFSTFENVGVAASNPGYIKIKNEIIKYTGFSGNNLTGITRQQDSTQGQNYVAGDIVTKYELGGVSLRRINTTHNLANVTDANPITLDSYKIKLDMGANGIGRTSSESFPQLKVKETKSGGGNRIHASQNMAFDLIKPLIQNTTVQGTNLSAEIKTVSGTSVNTGSGQGSDTPFVVQGTESVAINQSNYMNTPRIIASRVNETNNDSITVLPGDRSFNMTLNLNSNDSRISPTVDMERISALLVSNRVDKLISNFKNDNRVDGLDTDPSAFQYVSKENVLQTSGTSLKVVLDAHINEYTDIRAFFAISENPGFDPIFVPFPGFNNLNERGQVISIDESDGKTDALTPPSEASGFVSDQLQFKELTFSINDLPSFRAFRVKFVLTSTNQVYVPRVSNLKVIALA
jgi:hypothetical protein